MEVVEYVEVGSCMLVVEPDFNNKRSVKGTEEPS